MPSDVKAIGKRNTSVSKPKTIKGARSDWESRVVARTELGRELLRLRKKAIAEGLPLIGWDELDAEMNELRGTRE